MQEQEAMSLSDTDWIMEDMIEHGDTQGALDLCTQLRQGIAQLEQEYKEQRIITALQQMGLRRYRKMVAVQGNGTG